MEKSFSRKGITKMSNPIVKFHIPLQPFYMGIPKVQFEISLSKVGESYRWSGDYGVLHEFNKLYRKISSEEIVYANEPFSMPTFIRNNYSYSSMSEAMEQVISFVTGTN